MQDVPSGKVLLKVSMPAAHETGALVVEVRLHILPIRHQHPMLLDAPGCSGCCSLLTQFIHE